MRLCLSQMQIYMYNSDDFDSLSAALRERRIIAAMAVFFQVGARSSMMMFAVREIQPPKENVPHYICRPCAALYVVCDGNKRHCSNLSFTM